MKGLSIVLSIGLLLLVHHLAARMQRAGTLPANRDPGNHSATNFVSKVPLPGKAYAL